MTDDESTQDGRPVVFRYSASTNTSFRGSDDSGYTWGEWRQMSKTDKREAYIQFIYEELGVDVYEVEPGDADD